MKKTLLAMTVAFAMAPVSYAADVEMYGLIDVGMSYLHVNPDIQGVDSTNKFSMENAQEFGSRWGLRGSEQLSNGLKIGFTLESGIESDTGRLDPKQGSSRIFGREASVNVSGSFGTVWAGRLPIFGSTLGANGLFRAIDPLFANYTTAFGSGFATASMWTRVDNALAYRTPTVSGFTGYAMYSFQNDATKEGAVESKSSSDRYGSLALRFQQGPVELVAVADTTNWANKTGVAETQNDGFTFTFGGNYLFDNGLKVLGFAQYFDNQYLFKGRTGVSADAVKVLAKTGKDESYGYVDGWGASLGLHYPVMGGTAKLAVNYRDMENQFDVDFKRWSVAGAYDYPLSKRTAVYAMTGYAQEKIKSGDDSAKPSGYQLSFGMVHKF